jgi:hypothetical protein
MNTRIYEGTNQARGDGHRLQCRSRWADMRDTRPRWGLVSAGGPTPYPHIALSAPVPELICSAPGIPAYLLFGIDVRCSALLLRLTLPLASCPENAVAPRTGGVHPDEVRRHTLDPRLKPGADDRRAFGLGIQMMRRSPHQHDPPLARLQIELR